MLNRFFCLIIIWRFSIKKTQKNKTLQISQSLTSLGVPEKIRTPDLVVRRQATCLHLLHSSESNDRNCKDSATSHCHRPHIKLSNKPVWNSFMLAVMLAQCCRCVFEPLECCRWKNDILTRERHLMIKFIECLFLFWDIIISFILSNY